MTKKKNPNIKVEDAEASEDAGKKKLTKAVAKQKAADKSDELPEFYVAQGKAICCKKHVLEYPAEVKAEWLGGGAEALASLVERGYVRKS